MRRAASFNCWRGVFAPGGGSWGGRALATLGTAPTKNAIADLGN